MTQNQPRLVSISSLNYWAQSVVKYFDNDNSMPYVLVDGLWHYFVQDKDKYFYLAMTSLKELEASK